MNKKNIEINENPVLSAIPVDVTDDESWRKCRPSCSGSGRIEKKFDLKHLDFMIKEESDNSD